MKTAFQAAVLVSVLAHPIHALAETITVSPGDDLAAAFATIAPGDEFIFSAGNYDLNAGLAIEVVGTSTAPISLRGEGDVVLEAPNGDFTLHFNGSFFSLSGVEIRGPGTAVIIEADDVQLHDAVITGATRGIECIGCASVSISDTEFFGLTDADGAAVHGDGFLRGFVENNWIHDVAGDGVVLDGQTAGNHVSDNTLEGLGGDGIRVALPPDLTSQPANQVLRNAVLAAPGIAIASSGAVLIASNLVIGPGTTGIHASVGDVAANVAARVLNNTVVGETECFRATDWSVSSATNVLANNALYCEEGIAIIFTDGGGVGTAVSKNIYLGSADLPGDSVLGVSPAADFSDAAGGDFYPSAGSALIKTGDDEWSDARTDFNQAMYMSPIDVGAYAYGPLSNPSPAPGGAFKGSETTVPGGTDAGTPGPDGGAGVAGVASSGAASGFPERDGGCSCGGGSQGLSALPFVLFLATRRRRRHRRDV